MSDKTNLQDVTFLIPVRIESMDRLENVLMVTEYLDANFDTNIHLLEADSCDNSILKAVVPDSVTVTFVEDHDPIFHRTKYINELVRKSSTPYLAIWDTDVIAPPGQVVKSVQQLRKEEADFVYPYTDNFFDTSKIVRELFLNTRDMNVLLENTGKMEKLYLPKPVGGAFLVNKKSYIESGIENEHFYGWGREDGERLNRWKILGYEHNRISGPLFHLTHDRGINSKFHTDGQIKIKHNEVLRILSMSKKELREEVKSWDN
ncbi:galactosyltransferase-related protein [Aliifodinibius sp. S!AR15-10]|uniref:galactosyltransferase-related protein n=1 Tax=Aliifodinibius sp. S!AR15-10 TaxID=2950437 RepID=UPI00285F72CF|nr:galactosyltransferase-related protein [Aliifodinibius sp. S!AR15-10]MDR8393836.1 galactosyltransferase-related protein [Aliifodinibius sp. S!AR15-10]